MIMRMLRIILISGLILVGVLSLPTSVQSISCDESCDSKSGEGKLNCLKDIQSACEAKLAETSAKKNTLQSTVDFLNSKITLTQSQINQTAFQILQLTEDINSLSGKISTLDFSLDQITLLLTNRIQASYKNSRINSIYLLLVSDGLKDFLTRYKYLQIVQANDRQAIYELEEARANFDAQKSTKEEKQEQVLGLQTELLGQKSTLALQQQEKELLLTVTKHEESRYQDQLDEARREISALVNSKFTGKRNVTKGESIGLMGNTGFSFGAHLHFGVFNNVDKNNIDDVGNWYYSNHRSPTSILQSKNLIFEQSSCDGVNSRQNKTVGEGGFVWPMANPRITQCYGHTPWSYRYSDGTHKGLDMADTNDIVVKAVNDGEAYFYAASGSFGNNVRILHADGTMTLYLHLR